MSSSESVGSSESEGCSDEFSQEELINHEFLDEVLDNDVDEDTLETQYSTYVDVDGQHEIPSNRTSLNCLVVLLAFFWTYFPFPITQLNFC